MAPRCHSSSSYSSLWRLKVSYHSQKETRRHFSQSSDNPQANCFLQKFLCCLTFHSACQPEQKVFSSPIQCSGHILKNLFDFGAGNIFIPLFIYIWAMLLTPSARDFILTVYIKRQQKIFNLFLQSTL